MLIFSTFPVPGPVSGLSGKVISSESVNISWNVPMEPNGDIVGYSVSYREIGGNTSEKFELRLHNLHKVIKSLSEFFLLACICIMGTMYSVYSHKKEW